MKLSITFEESRTIVNGLRAAVTVFTRDNKACFDAEDFRSAAQFEKQAFDSAELADKIDLQFVADLHNAGL